MKQINQIEKTTSIESIKQTNIPLVSIIIPVYNVEKYMSQCLDSIIGQTLHDIEIILIDDCGRDNSMKIANNFAKQDDRIKIIKHEKNSGLSAARNTGIKNSTANFIMFCDSDDWYEPEMCEKMLNAIEKSGADLAVCGCNVIYETDEKIRKGDDKYFSIKFNGLQEITDEILNKTDVSVWNKIYRREIIERNNICFPVGLKYEDSYFFNVYCLWATKIFYLSDKSDKLYNYRRRVGSIMNQTFAGNAEYAIDYTKIAIAFYDYLIDTEKYLDRMAYFWSYFLIRFNLTFSHSGNSMRAAYDLSKDFLKSHRPLRGELPFWLERNLDMIMNETIEKRTIFGGIIKILKNMDKKRINFLGICLWKIKYTPNQQEYFLFGFIRVAKIKKSSINFILFPNKRHFSSFKIDNTVLLNELHKINAKFIYIPNPGNMGNILIAKSTVDFFDINKLNFDIYNGKPAKNIVYGGGGIWTNDYKEHWLQFLPIFKKADRIIILPSSFNNCPDLIHILDERFIIFCREQKSYDYMVLQNTKAKIILDHDMAFRCTKSVLCEPEYKYEYDEQLATIKIFDTISKIKDSGIAYFMRRDKEVAGNYKTDLDISSQMYGGCKMTRELMSSSTLVFLSAIDCFHTIITDRLHVGIAGALMGKEVYLLDNSYGKLSNVYKQSMKDNPQIHFCDTIPDVETLHIKHVATDNIINKLKEK